MPTIVWLTAGAGVWLAAVNATCALLTVAQRAGAAAAGAHARGPDCRALPARDAAGLVGPPGAVLGGVREPALAGRMRVIASDGSDRRRRRRRAGRVELDRSSSAHSCSYALHVRDAMVARLCWRADPGEPAGWYVWQRRGGWRRLAVDP